MTDHWSRADGGPGDGSLAIEVPLTGPDEAPRAAPDDDHGADREGGGRRVLVAAAAIVALIVGVVVAVQVVGGDDEAAPPSTDVDALAAQITTPPTLGPLDTLPTPDDPALADAPLDEGPQPTSSQDWSLFDGEVTRPSYPAVTDVGLPELVTYDIDAAVARLAEDVPRRSQTRLELGTAGFVLDVTIERDPERDRYFVLLESRGESQEATVDLTTGTTYVRSNGEFVADIPNEEIIRESTATTVGEYFDRLLLGPVRPDSFQAQATRGRGIVTIDDVRLARQFIANVQGSQIPEWQLYAFSPVFEFPVEDRPSRLEYAVYVDDGGDIVQVDGVALVGDVPQLVVHELMILETPTEIELPPDVIAGTITTTPPATDPGATGSSVTTPTSTSSSTIPADG